jgi:hypothetical protein
MGDLCRLIWCLVADLIRSRAALHAEILVLRHQLNVLRRKSPNRLVFRNVDRFVFAGLYDLTPRVLDAVNILKAGNGDPVASSWFPCLLALEVTISRRPTESIGRTSSAHSRDEHREPAVGRAAHPRRACPCRKLTLGYIGGAARLKLARPTSDRRSGRRGGSARPSAAISGCGPRCNIFDTI